MAEKEDKLGGGNIHIRIRIENHIEKLNGAIKSIEQPLTTTKETEFKDTLNGACEDFPEAYVAWKTTREQNVDSLHKITTDLHKTNKFGVSDSTVHLVGGAAGAAAAVGGTMGSLGVLIRTTDSEPLPDFKKKFGKILT